MSTSTAFLKIRILAIVTICFATSNTSYSQFSAQMTNVVQGNQREYKVYSNLDKYRYEFNEAGMKGIVIVAPKENKTYVLMPDRQYVHITSCDGRMSRMNDPWQSYVWINITGTNYYKLKTQNNQQQPGKFSYTLYEMNTPLSVDEQGREKYRTYRLFSNEKKTLTLDLSSGQRVMLKGFEGTLGVQFDKE
jgi:hypothetical protein